jgi:Bax protein
MMTGSVTTPERWLTTVGIILLISFSGSSCTGGDANHEGNSRPVERFEFRSYADTEPLMERFNYTPESWQAGIREVPRIYLTDIPSRWRDSVSNEVSVLVKKRLFFRMLAPLVLRANELIIADRERLTALATEVNAGKPLDPKDGAWLADLAGRHRVIDSQQPLPGPDELGGVVEELLVRVDFVPLSLVLAQGAEESGWGTSRFAAEGNAIFGQWTWGGEGITPKGQRKDLGDYRIAAFETPLLSIMSYLRNLNSHPAYAELRDKRAELRGKGERISGYELAKTLTRYSERGQEYVDSLHAIMRVNQLDAADDAHLGDTPTIYLIPVGQGTE